jgi:hypothetical protein
MLNSRPHRFSSADEAREDPKNVVSIDVAKFVLPEPGLPERTSLGAALPKG